MPSWFGFASCRQSEESRNGILHLSAWYLLERFQTLLESQAPSGRAAAAATAFSFVSVDSVRLFRHQPPVCEVISIISAWYLALRLLVLLESQASAFSTRVPANATMEATRQDDATVAASTARAELEEIRQMTSVERIQLEDVCQKISAERAHLEELRRTVATERDGGGRFLAEVGRASAVDANAKLGIALGETVEANAAAEELNAAYEVAHYAERAVDAKREWPWGTSAKQMQIAEKATTTTSEWETPWQVADRVTLAAKEVAGERGASDRERASAHTIVQLRARLEEQSAAAATASSALKAAQQEVSRAAVQVAVKWEKLGVHRLRKHAISRMRKKLRISAASAETTIGQLKTALSNESRAVKEMALERDIVKAKLVKVQAALDRTKQERGTRVTTGVALWVQSIYEWLLKRACRQHGVPDGVVGESRRC